MRIVRVALVAATLAAAPAFVSASDQPVASKDNATVTVTAQSNQFTAVKGIKAVPMSSNELKAVKGQHVHFITISNGKLHLAGDVKTQNNWENLGGTDGRPVAPSYHGLCVAHGNGQIFIPTGPPGTPVTLQCPAGS